MHAHMHMDMNMQTIERSGGESCGHQYGMTWTSINGGCAAGTCGQGVGISTTHVVMHIGVFGFVKQRS